MQAFWWQLPGPHRFVLRVGQDLRDGKNVILCLPQYAPGGLVYAIRSALSESDGWSWYALHVPKDDPGEPVRLLYSRFIPDSPPQSLRNAKTLSQEEAFAGKVIWLDGVTPKVWPAWKAFIADYEHACRSCSLLERTLFCIPLIGELALNPPAEDVCLSHHYWRGAVDRLDMLLFTTSFFQDRRMPSVQKRVVTSVIANIAQWDPAVTERFASEDFQQIFHPLPILQEIAKERGWGPEDDVPLFSSWCKGTMDFVEGEASAH